MCPCILVMTTKPIDPKRLIYYNSKFLHQLHIQFLVQVETSYFQTQRHVPSLCMWVCLCVRTSEHAWMNVVWRHGIQTEMHVIPLVRLSIHVHVRSMHIIMCVNILCACVCTFRSVFVCVSV